MNLNEENFDKKLFGFKLTYNGAKLTDRLQGAIDYILEDKYTNEQNEAIRVYKLQHKNVKIVNISYFYDILEKRDPFSY